MFLLKNFPINASRRDPKFPQPREQILLRPIALDAVAVGAQLLQVLDVVLTAGALGDDVVHLQNAKRELAAAAVAPAFLLAEQDMLVLTVGYQGLDIGAPGDVGAGCYQPIVEQVGHGLLQAHADQFDGLGRDVAAGLAPVQIHLGFRELIGIIIFLTKWFANTSNSKASFGSSIQSCACARGFRIPVIAPAKTSI